MLAAACNMLTGASELTPCEGAACADGSLVVDEDPHDTHDTHDTRDRTPDARVDDDAAPEGPPVDASGPETGPYDSGSTCPLCDGGACCAPNVCVIATGQCGACSASKGPCQVDSDCCDELKCTAGGKCASTCKSKGQDCVSSTGGCCLGLQCSVHAGYECVSCQLGGASCTESSKCCSESCVNGSCVGNVK